MTSPLQSISQTKLAELSRQRTRLSDQYARLNKLASQQTTKEARLNILYKGLRELRFADQPIHAEIANLEVLLNEMDHGQVEAGVLDLWLRRLESEVDIGQRRADISYLYGSLLNEWASQPSAKETSPATEEVLQDLLRTITTRPGTNPHKKSVSALFNKLTEVMATSQGMLKEIFARRLYQPVTDEETKTILSRIAQNIYAPSEVRTLARQFREDEALRKELGDTITVLLVNVEDWTWPETGVPMRALWTRNKWRLFLDIDLINYSFLETYALRVLRLLGELVHDSDVSVGIRKTLKQLVDMDTQHPIYGYHEDTRPEDGWTSLSLLITKEQKKSKPIERDNYIKGFVEREQIRLRRITVEEKYGGYEGREGILQPINLINTEIQMARTLFPNTPIFVIKADLKDYYPTIPHDLIRTVLSGLGFGDRELAFIAKYLQMPVASGAKKLQFAQQGVPMGFLLSDLLGELIMRLLERTLRLGDTVQVIRMRDDICILSHNLSVAVAAWNKLRAFCKHCGLQINLDKSGSVCIGGVSSKNLPKGTPRWAMLELDNKGNWGVHASSFKTHLTQSRSRVDGSGSVLSAVQTYNANLQFLLNSLAISSNLGDEHRKSITSAIREFHYQFFPNNTSIAMGIRQRLLKRFLKTTEKVSIPEGWLYWPLTAGGLSIANGTISMNQYLESYNSRKTVPAPSSRGPDWYRSSEWGPFLNQFLEPFAAKDTEETRLMTALVADFIERGKTVSSGKQESLAPYWKWVLYVYGPQIIEMFGGFHFLPVQLVPVQLIRQQILVDTTLSDAT